MGKWLFLLLFASLLFLSCSSVLPRYAYTRHPPSETPERTILVFIDKDFSDPDRVLIDDAIRSWNYALNGYIRFDIASTSFNLGTADLKQIQHEDAIAIMKIDSDSVFIPESEEGLTLAFTIDHKWIYMIRDRERYDLMFQGTMRHELGHIFISKHVDEHFHHSLMNPGYTDEYNQCIDYWTIRLVSKTQGIDINKLNYCHYEFEDD